MPNKLTYEWINLPSKFHVAQLYKYIWSIINMHSFTIHIYIVILLRLFLIFLMFSRILDGPAGREAFSKSCVPSSLVRNREFYNPASGNFIISLARKCGGVQSNHYREKKNLPQTFYTILDDKLLLMATKSVLMFNWAPQRKIQESSVKYFPKIPVIPHSHLIHYYDFSD